MLVLSRRPDEKVVLPSVPAVIKVISSQAGLVRLGIEAPAHVPILREELCREDALPGAQHDLRARLDNLTHGLSLLRRQLKDGGPAVRHTLETLEEELRGLRRQLGAAGPRDGLALVGRAGA
jgi:carbon storage regulator CsrA